MPSGAVDVADILAKSASRYGGTLLSAPVFVLMEWLWAAAATATDVPGLLALVVVTAFPVVPVMV
jgi:hypothetical protein